MWYSCNGRKKKFPKEMSLNNFALHKKKGGIQTNFTFLSLQEYLSLQSEIPLP